MTDQKNLGQDPCVKNKTKEKNTNKGLNIKRM